jgi:hypothetical protein
MVREIVEIHGREVEAGVRQVDARECWEDGREEVKERRRRYQERKRVGGRMVVVIGSVTVSITVTNNSTT